MVMRTPEQSQPTTATLNYATPKRRVFDRAAIASFLLGLFFFVPVIPALAAIVLGRRARRRLAEEPQMRGRLLAGLGIAFGLISILGFVASIPVALELRARQRRAICAAHLRELGTALLLYANCNKGLYATKLGLLIRCADVSPETFVCPLSADTPAAGIDIDHLIANFEAEEHCSFVYLKTGLTSRSPDSRVTMYERPGHHANGGMHVLFVDGHVEWFEGKKAAILLQELDAGHNPPQQK